MNCKSLSAFDRLPKDRSQLFGRCSAWIRQVYLVVLAIENIAAFWDYFMMQTAQDGAFFGEWAKMQH